MKKVRWKPEEGEQYYFVDALGNVDWYVWGDSADTFYYEVGNCFRTKEEAKHVGVLFKKLLQENILPETNCNQLPRLTAEVFDRPDCPKWANYAAVDECGSVRLFSDSPWLGESCWNWSNGEVTELFGVTFDASDWQKSRIKRPKKNTLPDWCKVGEWVYVPEIKEYFKITDIQGENLIDEHGDHLSYKDCVQARLCPYNTKEMKALMGKVIEYGNYLELITKYNSKDAKVYVDGWWANAEFLMNNGYTINGMPCGVLQNLKDGVWTR